MSEQKWGAITRKINFIDGSLEDDQRLPLEDGGSVDMYTIKKPKVLQTNYYGGETFQRHVTIFKDQLDVAMTGPDQFSLFLSGVIQNVMDMLEQIREEESRATLINFIAGKKAGDSENVINILQAYYDETGVELTPITMFEDKNFIPFTKWLYAYINTLMRKMSERTIKYHINVTDKEIHRHTPANKMKAYMSARYLDSIDSVTLPTIFGADRLKMIDWEAVTFWQNIDDPEKILATPTYLVADGSLETATEEVEVSNIVGVLFDEEALGITRINEWSMATNMNAAGGYKNIFWHFTHKLFNDFSENAVVLVAGDVTTS